MDVNTLLSTDAAEGRVLLASRVALSESNPGLRLPLYFGAMEDALKSEPPPFDTSSYADVYRVSSASPQWMAVSLITNAEREGDGAKRLWSLAACSDDPNIQRLLKSHAVDESRHALLYLGLLDLTFPGMVEPSFRKELNQLSPGYLPEHTLVAVPGSPYAKKPSIDDFLQMNIAELRTAIHHIMQRPALARHGSPSSRQRVTRIQESLLRDELKHVAYTAVLIEQLAATIPDGQLAALFRRRFHDFNGITRDELHAGAFDCSVACCTRHPGCREKASPPNEAVVSLPSVQGVDADKPDLSARRDPR